MDLLTFIATVLQAIAWPAVVICVLTVFRKDLTAILSRLVTVKHKETELQFARELADAATKAKEDHPDGAEFLATSEAKKAMAILEVSPSAAVIAAWVDFEAAARKAVQEKQAEGKRPLSVGEVVKQLEQRRLIHGSDAAFLKTLQQIRNVALHQPDIYIDQDTAYNVVTVLLRLSWEIRNDQRK